MPVSKIRGVNINWQVIGAKGPLGRHDQRRAAEL